MPDKKNHTHLSNHLRLRRSGIDTYQQAVIYMHRDCLVCRSEGFEAQSRIAVTHRQHTIIATLNTVESAWLATDEAALSKSAWGLLGANEGDEVTVAHPSPIESLSHVRAKIYGQPLDFEAFRMIINDVVTGRYSDIELSAFITACADERLNLEETIALTRAMVGVGERLSWPGTPIVDKHSVGGLPGNRTTPIVVSIVTALGLTMPKTSSRAITSPAGTADCMETLAPVDLDIVTIRRVVEQEGGCIVWGGAVRLSPADDVLIRVERPLDLDSEGQLVASVLSKKVAAGSTHVILDIPVGHTAKVRSQAAAERLAGQLTAVGTALGLKVRPVFNDGSQPVGRGIGPALEAHDVLSVLRNERGAPADLRERALGLSAGLLELAGKAPEGGGYAIARAALDDGSAWRKFQAIAAAQGGLRQPPVAHYKYPVVSTHAGRVIAIDNRRMSRAAKLAGAPRAAAAGAVLHTPLQTQVESGQPLYTLHAETAGELEYALTYVASQPEIIRVEPL
jgi:thymidine phosphorylase